MLHNPIKFNDYYKFVVQLGWVSYSQNSFTCYFGPVILSKTIQDAEFILKFLYPISDSKRYPSLCSVYEKIVSSDLNIHDSPSFVVNQFFAEGGLQGGKKEYTILNSN